MRYDRARYGMGLVAALLVALLVAGCAARGEIEVLNDDLTDQLEIKKLKSRLVGGLTQGQLRVRNKSKKPQSFQVKFIWFDSQGFQIDNEAASWLPVMLQGREEKTVQAVAPNDSAKTYKVLIR